MTRMEDFADYGKDFIRDFQIDEKNWSMYDATKIVEEKSERFSEISRLISEVNIFKNSIRD
jgi:hypothetical protein